MAKADTPPSKTTAKRRAPRTVTSRTKAPAKPAPKTATTARPASKTSKAASAATKPAATKAAASTRKTPATPSTSSTSKSASPKSRAPRRSDVPHQRPWIKTYPEGIKWDADLDVTPVHARVSKAVEKFPDNIALDFMGNRITYADMWSEVEAFAGALQKELGVKKGSRVALLLPNTPFYVYAYYAVLMAGGTVVNCNPLYSLSEIEHLVANSGSDVMVTLDLEMVFEKAEKLCASGKVKTLVVCPFVKALPTIKSWLFRLAKRGELANPHNSIVASHIVHYGDLIKTNHKFTPVEIEAEKDVAVQQYTGGTTGIPKGAMLSHANISANVSQINSWGCGLFEPPTQVVAVLPFFHIFAMTVCLNLPLSNGAGVVMLPRFDLKTFLSTIKRTKANVLPAVPTLTQAIANSPHTKREEIESLEIVVSGGAALPNETRKAFAKVSDGRLAEGYGLTETSPVACCAAFHGPAKNMSIGMPIPGTDIRFVDIENPDREVKQGERGELQIKGAQVMLGYFDNKQATEDAFIDGWFRTGDVGYMDEEGYVFLVDRIKDLIITSGFNIYPRNIEEALYKHPAIDECNVIGAKDEYRGEIPVAFIKLHEGKKVTAEELKEFLTDHLSKIELPREFVFKKELPKTLVGKLSKKELREEYEKVKAGKSERA